MLSFRSRSANPRSSRVPRALTAGVAVAALAVGAGGSSLAQGATGSGTQAHAAASGLSIKALRSKATIICKKRNKAINKAGGAGLIGSRAGLKETMIPTLRVQRDSVIRLTAAPSARKTWNAFVAAQKKYYTALVRASKAKSDNAGLKLAQNATRDAGIAAAKLGSPACG